MPLKAIIRGKMSFIDSSGFKSYDGLVEVEYDKSAIALIMAKPYLARTSVRIYGLRSNVIKEALIKLVPFMPFGCTQESVRQAPPQGCYRP
jgi:hypothetical protein